MIDQHSTYSSAVCRNLWEWYHPGMEVSAHTRPIDFDSSVSSLHGFIDNKDERFATDGTYAHMYKKDYSELLSRIAQVTALSSSQLSNSGS